MNLTCSICLDDIINFNEKKTLKCEHMYHKECINKVQNNKCPLCKKEIKDSTISNILNNYFIMSKQVELLKIENENLKKKDQADIDIIIINNNISNSIKKNKYNINISAHFHIDVNKKTPLHCNHCNLKTSKYGTLYNHVNNKHCDKFN